ncbi:MAG: hypothetical protein QGI86_27645 [Candidatus Poribacteria bacterium]|nr:hypothetical protein [Candidatus Poribacteria bacterium]
MKLISAGIEIKPILTSLFLLLLAPFILTVEARKKPAWVTNHGRSEKYSQTRYLTGFGQAHDITPDSQQIALDNARASLSQQVLVKINNTISNHQADDGQNLSQQFSSVTHSSSALQVMGLKELVYVNDSRKNPRSYALVYILRHELAQLYQAKLKTLTSEIRQIIQLAENNKAQKQMALRYYCQTLPLFEQLTESQTILLSVSATQALADLANQELEELPPLPTKNEINGQIQQLALHSLDSLDDVAGAIMFQFLQQFDPEGKQTLVQPFFYQDTRLTAQISRYLKQLLESKWGNSVQAGSQFQARSVQYTREMAVSAGAEYIINGSYWEQGEEIKVLALCRQLQTGQVKASANVEFNRRILTPGQSLKPQNFEQAMAQQMAFAQQAIESNQLRLEVWTDRGKDALLYSQGELMTVYLRSNQPCHVRLLYILANGQKTLLVDNLKINAESINQALVINELLDIDFECSSPFGAEMLIAVGRNRPFDGLESREQNGYLFIEVDDPSQLASLTRGTRGFKRRKREDPTIEQTEAKLIITTVPFNF